MDSYIKLLWFFVFCVWVIETAPKEIRRALCNYAVRIIMIIVYGDDFLYNKGKQYADWFSGAKYRDFLYEFQGVVLRDLRDGIPFCSTVHNGWFVTKGASFLKMYAVINDQYTEKGGQCKFLPFRETAEFMMRCFNGREPKDRDVLDMLLSSLAHAYGTYGSNKDAYYALLSFYESLIFENDLMEATSMEDICSRLSAKDLKQYRMLGMELDDIKSGFPKLSTIQGKNVWDPDYHVITSYEMTSSQEVDWNYD